MLKSLTNAAIASLIFLSACKMPFSNSDEFSAQANPVANCPTQMFVKSATVFGALTICGTIGVPDEKLRHAANVAAGWLDNDQDGDVDEPRLLSEMAKNRPVVIMSATGFSNFALANVFNKMDGRPAQDLYASETNPEAGERDASQEEIHHIIMNAGWQKLAPATFSEDPAQASALYQIWEEAESKGYYNYNDPTCDASCKVTEFVYLATAAYLGSAADLASDEMRIKSKAELRDKLPAIVALFEDTSYSYPKTVWPDGNYRHNTNISYLGTAEP